MAKAKAKPQPEQERTRMPFITESLDDVYEPKAAPEGEYDLRIHKAVQGETKKGQPMVTATIVFDDGTDAPPFSEYLLGWDGDTPDEQIRMRKLHIKRFCAAFDVDEDFEAADLHGKTARIFVAQEAGQDEVVRNKLRLPRLQD